MTNIGITGSKGLLASLLIKKLKKKRVKFSIFKGDIINKKDISKWIAFNNELSVIFHFAAISSEKKCVRNKKKAIDVNVRGTGNLIKSIKDSNKKIWLFYPSSSHVYAFSNKSIKENFKKKPTSFYGRTKLLAERKIINSQYSNLSFCIGRIFSVYHKKQKKPFLYPSIKEKIKNNKNFFLYIKNALSIRDFLNAEKIINIIFKIYKKKLTGIYNIGSGKGITIERFIKKSFKIKKKIFSNNEFNCLVSDNNKLKNKLNAKKF